MAVETFNLALPPNFQGLDPDAPLTSYYRHLPHWRQAGATYFATFRLGDALPNEKRSYLKRIRDEWERSHPEPRSNASWEVLGRELFRYEDAWLDEGYGSCCFRDRNLVADLAQVLLHFQNERYFVSCWAVMPNHCHLLIRPFKDWTLEKILQGIKGVSSHQINGKVGSSGSLWQDESYDRIVRDEEHLWRVVQYIGNNPLKAGLALESWRRWIEPSWQAAGWRFVDT